jgi:hypothetical protein
VSWSRRPRLFDHRLVGCQTPRHPICAARSPKDSFLLSKTTTRVKTLQVRVEFDPALRARESEVDDDSYFDCPSNPGEAAGLCKAVYPLAVSLTDWNGDPNERIPYLYPRQDTR